jgi:flagellar basal-body rod modification protein FlgD
MDSLLAASQAGTQASAGKTGGSGSDYDPQEQRQIFMKMLTAQLENQNPLNPMKGQEMTAQLAQFSGVEQQIRTNELLTQLTNKDQGSQRLDAVSMLGKSAWLEENQVTSTVDGQSHRFRFNLDSGRNVEAVVSDGRGNVVDRIALGSQAAGTHTAAWDGQTASGQPAPAGQYRIEVYPKGQESPEPIGTQTESSIQEVRFGDQGPELGIAGGRFIPFDRVAAVSA